MSKGSNSDLKTLNDWFPQNSVLKFLLKIKTNKKIPGIR